jgi:fluoride exporter
MKHVLFVGLGGALGSMARYLVQKWFAASFTHPLPWATVIVNISGCFLIGLFWGVSFRSFESNENWKLFLMTGICGGYTTLSAFTLEGIGLLREEKTTLFIGYATGTIILGFLATWIGMKLTR